MGLDDLVRRFEKRAQAHMTARNKQELRTDWQELRTHSLDSARHAYLLDDARAALRYQAFKQKRRRREAQPYTSLAQEVEDATHKWSAIDSKDLLGFSLLTKTRSHYTSRFKELDHFLDASNEINYSDALLCREHLRKDPYLRRRARSDESFKEELGRIQKRVDTYVSTVRKPMARIKAIRDTRESVADAMRLGWEGVAAYSIAAAAGVYTALTTLQAFV